jgi:phage shock protein A
MSGKLSESDKNTGATATQLKQFQNLLNQLEASKMRQQRQRSVEGRRDIYSQGLASMMSNF